MLAPGQLNVETDEWLTQAETVLKAAKKRGATQAEVGLSLNVGLDVSVRMGEVDTVEFNRDKGFGITVYFDQCKGTASTTDTRPDALQATVDAACDIAQSTQADSCAGLADVDRLAQTYPDLDLAHPWDIDAVHAIELAQKCEAHARAHDKRISNSDGVNVSTNHGWRVYANSLGFVGHYAGTRHSLSCMLLAESAAGMQRDYDYTTARDPKDLKRYREIAESAAERTVARLDARPIATQQAPIIFATEEARGFIGHFLAAISGGNLYRRSSFLLDHLDKSVFPDFIQIKEDPHIPKAMGSTPFDSEGVRTEPRDLVTDGILRGYILGSYSARKLGLQTTGNAGGAHNIIITPGEDDLAALLKRMGTGFLVTELMGHGVKIVTGDYSRGASGFWVENGQIQFPVEGVTIAGNLRDMYANIIAVGNDVDLRGNIHTGSILVDNVMIAGT